MDDSFINPTLERALLGALLLDGELLEELDVYPELFARLEHKIIFKAMASLRREGTALDVVTVAEKLRRMGKLATVGGEAYLIRLLDSVPLSAHAPGYVRQLKDLAVRRKLLEAGAEIAKLSSEPRRPEHLLAQAQQLVARLSGRVEEDVLFHGETSDLLFSYLEEMEKLRKENRLILTPWGELNVLLGCLRRGNLYTVAGVTAVGKTSFLEQIAEFNARRGFQVCFFHLELSPIQMILRRLMRNTGVHYYRFEMGEEMDRALEAEEEIKGWKGGEHFIHCPGWVVEQIVAKLKVLVAAGKCDLAVVDYLQKIPLPRRNGFNQAALLGMVVERLKTAAEQLAVPLLLGCQISRGVFQTGDKKPHLHHLRGSGEIAEKSNYVIFMHRPELMDTDLASPEAEIYLEKPITAGFACSFDSLRLRFVSDDMLEVEDEADDIEI